MENNVEWQGCNSPIFVKAHGMTFNNKTKSGFTYKTFVKWLAEECSDCLRIWVNNIVVWDWENGWLEKINNILYCTICKKRTEFSYKLFENRFKKELVFCCDSCRPDHKPASQETIKRYKKEGQNESN